jgi:hypothetical protein
MSRIQPEIEFALLDLNRNELRMSTPSTRAQHQVRTSKNDSNAVLPCPHLAWPLARSRARMPGCLMRLTNTHKPFGTAEPRRLDTPAFGALLPYTDSPSAVPASGKPSPSSSESSASGSGPSGAPSAGARAPSAAAGASSAAAAPAGPEAVGLQGAPSALSRGHFASSCVSGGSIVCAVASAVLNI